jgi:hypothetical protein
MNALSSRSRLLPVVLLALVGCKSPSSGPSGALVSVTMDCPVEARMRLTLIEVFEQAGYKAKSAFTPELTFERPGSVGADILRRSWYSGKTLERVRVDLTPSGSGGVRVDLNAFIVQYPDDRVMEEEFRIHSRGRYEKLMEQVRQRVAELAHPPAVP